MKLLSLLKYQLELAWMDENVDRKLLRAILRESEAKLEKKNYNPPFIFCVELGYLGG